MQLNSLILFLTYLILSVSAAHNQQHRHDQQYPMSGEGSNSNSNMAGRQSLNVFKGPLSFFSSSPMTGFLRNGYCDVPTADMGNHSVAAEVTEEFLDYTARQGNDLRIAGLSGGCKWCLCASRWLEAFEARKNDSDPVVPKVFLSATNIKALNKVELDDLKKFAAKEE